MHNTPSTADNNNSISPSETPDSSTKPRRLKFTPPTPIARPVQTTSSTNAVALRNEASPNKQGLVAMNNGGSFFCPLHVN